MSAAAPALANAPQRRIVTVRLADSGIVVAYLSLIFGLLLVVLPVSFPRLIMNSWQNGSLMLAVTILALAIDAYLYIRIAYLLSAKPTVLAAACLGSLPIIVVVGHVLLLDASVAHTLAADLPNLKARVGEEVLAHTYFSLVSAIFVPFVVIRLLQQFKSRISRGRTASPSF